MAKTAFGRDIKEFWTTAWPEGFFVDDMNEEIVDDGNGTPILEDDEEYDLDLFGYLAEHEPGEKDNSGPFSKFFSKWLKSRDYKVISVQVPKDRADHVKKELIMLFPDLKIS